jgi:hypothetical protein
MVNQVCRGHIKTKNQDRSSRRGHGVLSITKERTYGVLPALMPVCTSKIDSALLFPQQTDRPVAFRGN